jgi:hypothetical protein
MGGGGSCHPFFHKEKKMKQKKITSTMQKVACDILSDFEILVMRHNGPYTFDEVWNIVQENSDKYGLCNDPFTGMICTSEEYAKNRLEYDRQTMYEKYGHWDGLD